MGDFSLSLRIKSVNNLIVFSVFSIIFYIPPIIQIFFKTTSYSHGFLIAGLFCAFFQQFFLKHRLSYGIAYLNRMMFYSFCFLMLHSLLLLMFVDDTYDPLKQIAGFALLFSLYFQSRLVIILLNSSKPNDFISGVSLYLYTNFFFALLAALWGVSVFGVDSGWKPIFIYSEVSHFALGIAPFLCFYCVITKSMVEKLVAISTCVLVALLMKNLTLLVVVLLILLIVIKSFLKLTVCFLLIMVGAILVDPNYFLDRLSVTYSPDNITNVVYLFGWDQIIFNLYNTSFLGLGFQQMGLVDPSGNYADVIFSLNGEYTNRFDGSFLASKIVSEFGIFGIAAIFTITYISFMSFRYIKSSSKLMLLEGFCMQLFASSALFMYFIYIYVRGGGVFHPFTVLVCASFSYICSYKLIKNES